MDLQIQQRLAYNGIPVPARARHSYTDETVKCVVTNDGSEKDSLALDRQ